MNEVYQHWYETARYQEVAAFQWYLQMKWLDMRGHQAAAQRAIEGWLG